MTTAQCAGCGAAVRDVGTVNGGTMFLDPEPHESGNIWIDEEGLFSSGADVGHVCTEDQILMHLNRDNDARFYLAHLCDRLRRSDG